jgi:hypothetical protein
MLKDRKLCTRDLPALLEKRNEGYEASMMTRQPHYIPHLTSAAISQIRESRKELTFSRHSMK